MTRPLIALNTVITAVLLWLTGCGETISTAPCDEAWGYNRKVDINKQVSIPYMKTCGLNMATAKTLDDAYGTNKTLSQPLADSIYDILAGVDKVLTAHKIPYFLNGGTMLGAVRNGGLIPNDDDADIVILETDLDKVKSLEREFKEEGLVFADEIPWFGGLNIKRAGGNSAMLDIFTMKERTINTSTWLSYAADAAFKSWPNDLVDPQAMKGLRRISFGHLNLLALPEPAATKHLTVNYGTDWYRVTYKDFDHFKATSLDRRKVDLKPEDYYFLAHSSQF